MAKLSDRRVQRTRKLLHDALMDLMLEKGYEAVTVQDIVDRANVGRSTFYAHFTDKKDLLMSGSDQLQALLSQEQITAQATHGRSSALLLGFGLPMFRHAQANYRLYQAMVAKGGSAIVDDLVGHSLTNLVHDELAALAPSRSTLPVPLEIVVLYSVSSFMALLKWWLDHKMPFPAEEMDRMFRALTIPGLTALGFRTKT